MKVLWGHSHHDWLVFESFIPTYLVFRSEHFFVTFYTYLHACMFGLTLLYVSLTERTVIIPWGQGLK